ncbi:dihydroorotase [Exophiala xenobiotica]|uniref:dihydroorotase n=1 Tax=Lithohypha guttulata TaxID=1690604 RepID=A0ABR0KMV7_9EURO|nr:dihydroorotase [Lithohypha guttulata]KAK5325444.1 dihydroorotase [Exophiala xenobiotica]
MSSFFDGIELPAAADFHVHLRDDRMMEAVTPTIRQGGVDTVFVMPNLVPPVTTVSAALDYKKRLQAIEPNVSYLMSLYLHSSITPDTIREAKRAGIAGVKSYPAGVTTNSSSGVVDYESFYPVFAAMEEVDMVLNLHGEAPPSSSTTTDPMKQITVLNAEEAFLPTLKSLHERFPRLRIILEHCTTAAAVEAVKQCGPNVAGTITAHHLFLTIDDWAGDPINFCKPVAKLPSDRVALLKAATSGDPKFFFGSDSAPHLLSAKKGLSDGGLGAGKCAAGVFTQPNVLGFVLEAFDNALQVGIVKESGLGHERVQGFLGGYGRKFYGVPQATRKVRVKAGGMNVQNVTVGGQSGNEAGMNDTVVTFRSGKPTYAVEWI